MAIHYQTEAFVFKKEDRLETDRIFSMFTKEFGRIEVFARAIRKIASKLRGNVEIFSFSTIEFIQGKNRKTLTDAVLTEKFKRIVESPEKLTIAYRVSNLLDNFIRGEEKDDTIFHLLHETFDQLNNGKLSAANYPLMYYYFFWNLVSVLGHRPQLSKCSVCSSTLHPYHLYFSSQEGGVICNRCYIAKRGDVTIASDIVKILRLFLKKDWNILPKLRIEGSTLTLLKEISDDYYVYLLNSYSLRGSN